MVNTAWAVYSKTGSLLLGPLSLASIWAGFEVPDCEDNSGDPIVVHDQLANRWILTQFTTAGPTYYNCIAVSITGDATGSYYRYAFSTGPNFPDYPKYGVWPNTYVATTREFDPADNFAGIGVYGLERAKMLRGNPTARAVSVLYPPGSTPWITGDGWLPSDLDGNRRPPAGSPNYLAGTQDDEGPYGAPFLGAEPQRHPRRADPAAGGRVRLRLPMRPAGLAELHPPAGHQPAHRHPVLPATADLAAGLS
jgi:hypothetical protein